VFKVNPAAKVLVVRRLQLGIEHAFITVGMEVLQIKQARNRARIDRRAHIGMQARIAPVIKPLKGGLFKADGSR
jgi:hypothetical protein